MNAILCSGNEHKLVELRELLPTVDLEPLPATIELPPETGDTLLANARIKARAGATAMPNRWVIADDSGLCVDALDGAPGVRSARFAGVDASDHENNAMLLRELRHVPDADARRARFVCVLVAIGPNGDEVIAEGSVDGHIAAEPRGDQGFGYDPIFVPDGYGQTIGELGGQVKAQLSHRARAAHDLARMLTEARGD